MTGNAAYYAAILTGHPSVCLSVPHKLLTQREADIGKPKLTLTVPKAGIKMHTAL